MQRIGRESPRISDVRKVRLGAVRGAVAERHVALFVDSKAGHPAVEGGIGRVDLLLDGRGRDYTARDVELRPLWPYRRDQGSLHAMHDPQRLGAAHFAI